MNDDDPINGIEWMDAGKLQANDYNPNRVMKPEFRLLEHSLLTTGWVQPILVRRADLTIIDGFHRWRLAQDSAKVKARWGGQVPCALLDVDRRTAIVMTVRMNRAKGSHVAVSMAALVKELVVDLGLTREEVAKEMGASKAEVDVLLQEDVFTERGIANWKYSKAWYPAKV